MIPNTFDRSVRPAHKTLPDFSGPHSRAEQILSAPETVHLAVTYQCSENCLDCYSRRHAPFAKHELGTAEVCSIIDDVAESGVFQLAVGGGEPFERKDLCDILSHAACKALVVHLTTGQYVLKNQWYDALKHVKSLHIGIRSEALIHEAARITEELCALAEYAANAGIGLGANIIITRFAIRNIEKLTEMLLAIGFKRLIFLRYKPVDDYARWNKENPNAEELIIFKKWLVQAKRRYPQVMLRIDCASAFLMRDMDPAAAIRAGIKGCVAAERIISIVPDGSVYPCSQLVGHICSAGNTISDS
jgi:MoaA/NifB/PqqE/SkfB family radical SAM enzyme